MPRDPFEILGLPGIACQREVKKRYRLLSKQFHPDRNNDAEAEARFREIQWAYETLSGKQSQKDGTDGSASQETMQQPDPADWSEKLFAGFFEAMKAYGQRAKSRNSQKITDTAGNSPQNGGS